MEDLSLNGTAEQRFIIMLQERIDALTDELNQVKTLLKQPNYPPSNTLYETLKTKACIPSDPNLRAHKCFVRAYFNTKREADDFIIYLTKHQYVNEVFHFTMPTQKLLCDVEMDDGNIIVTDLRYEFPKRLVNKYTTQLPSSKHTVQALIRFDKTVYLIHFISEIHEYWEHYLYTDIQDWFKDEKALVVSGANDPEAYTEYEFHISAGQRNKPIEKLVVGEVRCLGKDNKKIARNQLYDSMPVMFTEFDTVLEKWHHGLNQDETQYEYVLLPFELHRSDYASVIGKFS